MAASAISNGMPTGTIRFGQTRRQTPARPAFGSTGTSQTQSAPAAGQSGSGLNRLAKRMIEWYQNNDFIHHKLYKWIGLKCTYGVNGYSSCSQYTKETIEKDGFLKGCFKGMMRILNCNPLTVHRFKKGATDKIRYLIA